MPGKVFYKQSLKNQLKRLRVDLKYGSGFKLNSKNTEYLK